MTATARFHPAAVLSLITGIVICAHSDPIWALLKHIIRLPDGAIGVAAPNQE